MSAKGKALAYLQLGRVSNLPTVWSNVLAGALLAGGVLKPGRVLPLLLAISLCYTGGMFLNDAFDREFDVRARPERPIPAGQASAREVFALGYGMLAAALIVLAAMASVGGHSGGWPALFSGLLLCGAIVLYDAWHKNNLLSPLLMGACRVLVYVTAALGVAGALGERLAWGAAVLLSYLIGLSYVAKQENLTEVKNLWPLVFLAGPFIQDAGAVFRSAATAVAYFGFAGWVCSSVALLARRDKGSIGRAVIRLIAGISLLDALLIARRGMPAAAALAAAAFAATLALQRFVRGT